MTLTPSILPISCKLRLRLYFTICPESLRFSRLTIFAVGRCNHAGAHTHARFKSFRARNFRINIESFVSACYGNSMQVFGITAFPLPTFPLTMFPLTTFSPNVTFPQTTFLGPLVVLTWPNLTRVTTAFGYYLTPAAGCWDQGYQVGPLFRA
jgi:hypothetical protein